MLRRSPSPKSLDSLRVALPLFITHIPLQDCNSPSNILDLLYASTFPSLWGYRSTCRLNFLQPIHSNLTFPSFHDIPFSRHSLLKTFPLPLPTRNSSLPRLHPTIHEEAILTPTHVQTCTLNYR